MKSETQSVEPARLWPVLVLPVLIVISLFSMAFISGCSSSQVNPLPALPEPPGYVSVPHPEGLDYGDLLAIFTDAKAPDPETLKTCDADFQKLRGATVSRDEIELGARELVKEDPARWHWCFYGKVYLLEKDMQAMEYIDDKQKRVLSTYLFLTPMAKAYFNEYQDSRYLRWAIDRYRKLSETLFFRRLDVNAQMGSELAGVASPLGSMRVDRSGSRSVLEKYRVGRTGAGGDVPGGVDGKPDVIEQGPVEIVETARGPETEPDLESDVEPALDSARAPASGAIDAGSESSKGSEGSARADLARERDARSRPVRAARSVQMGSDAALPAPVMPGATRR